MSFHLHILGSGSALPTVRRNPTAQLLEVHNEFFLIDCGEGTQIQLRQSKHKFQRISHIFISHLHGDHYLGLVGLLSTMHLLGRTKELHLHANSTLKEIIDLQLKVSDTRLRYELIFHPLRYDGEREIADTEKVKVYAFPLLHRIPTCGFRFVEKDKPSKINKEEVLKRQLPLEAYGNFRKGLDYIDDQGVVHRCEEVTLPKVKQRSYAFCSDTAYTENIIPYVKHVDLLYHESTFLQGHAKRASETYHSTAKQAATIARKSEVGRLIIGHYSARYLDTDNFMLEAKEVFPHVELAADGVSFAI